MKAGFDKEPMTLGGHQIRTRSSAPVNVEFVNAREEALDDSVISPKHA